MKPWRANGLFQGTLVTNEFPEGVKKRCWNFHAARAAHGQNSAPRTADDGRTHIMERSFAPARRVGMSRLRVEPGHAVSKRQTQSRNCYLRAKTASLGE